MLALFDECNYIPANTEHVYYSILSPNLFCFDVIEIHIHIQYAPADSDDA